MYNFSYKTVLPSFFLSLAILTGCGNDSGSPSKVNGFCDNIKIGSTLESVNASLDQVGLEVHTRAPEADAKISSLVRNPYLVDGVMITSNSLPYFEVVPACVVYFSSILYGGDDKIIHKRYITKAPDGI